MLQPLKKLILAFCLTVGLADVPLKVTAKLLPGGPFLYLTSPVGFPLLYHILSRAWSPPQGTAQTDVSISLPVAQIMSSFIHEEDLEMCMLPACIYIPCSLSATVLQSE